jgi:hypothetical protein
VPTGRVLHKHCRNLGDGSYSIAFLHFFLLVFEGRTECLGHEWDRFDTQHRVSPSIGFRPATSSARIFRQHCSVALQSNALVRLSNAVAQVFFLWIGAFSVTIVTNPRLGQRLCHAQKSWLSNAFPSLAKTKSAGETPKVHVLT